MSTEPDCPQLCIKRMLRGAADCRKCVAAGRMTVLRTRWLLRSHWLGPSAPLNALKTPNATCTRRCREPRGAAVHPPARGQRTRGGLEEQGQPLPRVRQLTELTQPRPLPAANCAAAAGRVLLQSQSPAGSCRSRSLRRLRLALTARWPPSPRAGPPSYELECNAACTGKALKAGEAAETTKSCVAAWYLQGVPQPRSA